MTRWNPIRAMPAAKLGPQAREFLAAFSAHRLNPDAKLSWYRATRLTDGREAVAAGRSVPAASAGPAGGEIAVSAEYGIGRRQVLGCRRLARLARMDRAGRRQPLVAGREPLANRSRPGTRREIAARTLLAELRQGAAGRRSWLLDITTDIGVPCIAAVSCRADGFGLAFGLAARPTLRAAARSAILEMCQIELAHAVVEAKLRERGEAALNEKDRIHRRRATMLNADRCLLLQPGPERARHLARSARPTRGPCCG